MTLSPEIKNKNLNFKFQLTFKKNWNQSAWRESSLYIKFIWILNKKVFLNTIIKGIFLCENSKIILYLIPFPHSKDYEKNIDFLKYKTDIKTINFWEKIHWKN